MIYYIYIYICKVDKDNENKIIKFFKKLKKK